MPLRCEVIEHLGGLDVCVANAGWYPSARSDRCGSSTVERWREVLDRNLTSAFLTARAFLASRSGRRAAGSLVFIASTAGDLRRVRSCRLRRSEGSDLVTGLLLSVEERGSEDRRRCPCQRGGARMDDHAEARSRRCRSRPRREGHEHDGSEDTGDARRRGPSGRGARIRTASAVIRPARSSRSSPAAWRGGSSRDRCRERLRCRDPWHRRRSFTSTTPVPPSCLRR